MENNKEELLLKEIEDFLLRNPKITRTELQSRKRNYYDFLTRRKLMDNYIPVQDNHISFQYKKKFDKEVFNELQKFINDNKIGRLSLFAKNYSELCKKGKIAGVTGKLKFSEKSFWKKDCNIINLDEVQKFIDEFEIENPSDLKYSFGGGIYYIITKIPGYKNNINYSNKIVGKYDHLTINDVQKLIDDNNYKTAKDFRSAQRGLYYYAFSKDWLKDLKYEKMFNSWTHLNTIEDFNNFIKKENICNSTELRERFPGLGIRISRKGFDRFLKYCVNTSGFRSVWEKELYDIIDNDSDFIKLERNVSFEDCKIINPLPFDLVFYSSKNSNIRIIVEIQGPTHFTNLYGNERLVETRKSDIIKHRWAEKKDNTFLFYYTNPKKIRCYKFNKRSSYPYYVYTSVKELINDIKKLI